MRHKRIGRKLGVTTKHRKSMLRNMVTDLFRNERLKTTDTRAKEIRRVAEKIITMAKEGSLHKRRLAGAYVRDKEVLRKLFDELAQKFKDRPGGYTRITKLGFRKGDNTPISVIELVEEEYKPSKKKKTAPKKKTTPKATDAPKAKSSKKESAEELGLIEDEEKKAAKALAEAAAVEETAEAVIEEVEAKAEQAPKEEALETKTQETAPEETVEEVKAEGSETVDSKEAPEAKAEAEPEVEKAEVAVSEPEAASEEESQVEERIEAKAEEVEETPEESSETEQDEEAQKKED